MNGIPVQLLNNYHEGDLSMSQFPNMKSHLKKLSKLNQGPSMSMINKTKKKN